MRSSQQKAALFVGSHELLALWLFLGPVATSVAVLVSVGLDASSSSSLLGSPGSGLVAIWCLPVLSSLEENDQNFQLQRQQLLSSLKAVLAMPNFSEMLVFETDSSHWGTTTDASSQ